MFKGKMSRGFTVTELLTVIAIISILLAIAVPSIREAVHKNALKNGARAVYGDFMNMRTAARVRQQTVIATINSTGYTAFAGDVLIVSNSLIPLQLAVEGGAPLPASLTFTSTGSITVGTSILITNPSWNTTMVYRLSANTTGLLRLEKSEDGGASYVPAL